MPPKHRRRPSGRLGQRAPGDGGPARQASLESPYNIALDEEGNLYVVDYGHRRVRKVAGAAPDGIITTVA